MGNTFSVKNFDRFQHYKDRSPPWIKLYNELLDDYEFGLLPDASKMHLVAIWLLASRSENKIPLDPAWVGKRINATEPVDLDLLASRGFILIDQALQKVEQVASKPLAECLSRERGETEGEKRRIPSASQTAGNENFETLKKVYPRRKGNAGWKAAERKFLSLVKTGVDPKIIVDAARGFAATAGPRVGTEFIPLLASWLNSEDFVECAVVAFDDACPPDIYENVL